MSASPDLVVKDLKQRKYAPVYFLQGEEPYYIDLISGLIEKECIAESEKSFNQSIFYGKETSLNTVIQRARQFPMMAERSVVIVKEAQELNDFGKEAGDNLLTAYLNNPMASNVLVFCYKYKTLDARKNLTKLIDKQALLVNSKKIYDNQLPEWIGGYLASRGCSIDIRAANMLTDYIGNDLNRIANECDKLLLNIKAGNEVTEDLVEQFVGISKEFNVFELQKALVKKDVLKANQIVNYFEANTKLNPIIPIISVLFAFFCKVVLVYYQGNKSEQNLAKVLQVNPFFVKDFVQACHSYSHDKLLAVIGSLRRADLMSKGIETTAIGEGQILRELVFQILH